MYLNFVFNMLGVRHVCHVVVSQRQMLDGGCAANVTTSLELLVLTKCWHNQVVLQQLFNSCFRETHTLLWLSRLLIAKHTHTHSWVKSHTGQVGHCLMDSWLYFLLLGVDSRTCQGWYTFQVKELSLRHQWDQPYQVCFCCDPLWLLWDKAVESWMWLNVFPSNVLLSGRGMSASN